MRHFLFGAALVLPLALLPGLPPISPANAEEEKPAAMDPAAELELLRENGMALARVGLAESAGVDPFAYVMRPDGAVQRMTCAYWAEVVRVR